MTPLMLAGVAAVAAGLVLAAGWAMAALDGAVLRRSLGLILASFAVAMLAASLGDDVEFKALALMMTVHAALVALIGAALSVRLGELYEDTRADRIAAADAAADDLDRAG